MFQYFQTIPKACLTKGRDCIFAKECDADY